MNIENALTEWTEAIGLQIIAVQEFYAEWFDDPVTITVLSFDNGKYLVQWDQPYYTTYSGVCAGKELEEAFSIIERIKK
jgi:hypothetical protein